MTHLFHRETLTLHPILTLVFTKSPHTPSPSYPPLYLFDTKTKQAVINSLIFITVWRLEAVDEYLDVVYLVAMKWIGSMRLKRGGGGLCAVWVGFWGVFFFGGVMGWDGKEWEGMVGLGEEEEGREGLV